jgi:DNA polymerase III delta prime subunit
VMIMVLISTKRKHYATVAVDSRIMNSSYIFPPFIIIILDEVDSRTKYAHNFLCCTMETYFKVTSFYLNSHFIISILWDNAEHGC